MAQILGHIFFAFNTYKLHVQHSRLLLTKKGPRNDTRSSTKSDNLPWGEEDGPGDRREGGRGEVEERVFSVRLGFDIGRSVKRLSLTQLELGVTFRFEYELRLASNQGMSRSVSL